MKTNFQLNKHKKSLKMYKRKPNNFNLKTNKQTKKNKIRIIIIHIKNINKNKYNKKKT